MTELEKLAAGHGWDATATTIMGLPATVWQRGDEIAVWWPAPEGSAPDRAGAMLDGRLVAPEELAGLLAAEPRHGTLTSYLAGDKAGIIAHLAAKAAERVFQSVTAGTLREARRLRAEAYGIELAISALQDWQRGERPRSARPLGADVGTK
jgi:hypothetical protein